ncbi:hypothetical protein GCM10009528_10230 [Kineococcus aurantiacus]
MRSGTTAQRRAGAVLPDDGNEEGTMADTWSGEFYCVKCKEKREAEGQVVETNGRRMAKGTCPVCGTNLNRILGKAS